MSLITRSEKYDGKRVAVAGYAAFGFEHSYLYFSPYDAQYSIDENAVWLEFDGSRFPNWRSLDHQTIEVEGTFHVPKGAAYWTNYPNGYIGEITGLQLSKPPGRFFGFRTRHGPERAGAESVNHPGWQGTIGWCWKEVAQPMNSLGGCLMT
jgi:hypothetical protein